MSQDVTVTGGSGGMAVRLSSLRELALKFDLWADELEAAMLVLARAEFDATALAIAAAPQTGLALEAATLRFFGTAAGADLRMRGLATALHQSVLAYESAEGLIAAAFEVSVGVVSNVLGHAARIVIFHPVTVAVTAVVGGMAVGVYTGVRAVWDTADEWGVFDTIEDVYGIDVDAIVEHGAQKVLEALMQGSAWAVQQAGAHSDATGALIEHALPGFVAGMMGIPPGLLHLPLDWGPLPRDSMTLTGLLLFGLSQFGFFGNQSLLPPDQYPGAVGIRHSVHGVRKDGGKVADEYADLPEAHKPHRSAPISVLDLWMRQWDRSKGRSNGQVRVEEIVSGDGANGSDDKKRRWIIYVPATTEMGLRAGPATTDNTTNGETASGRKSAQHEVVMEAVERSGISPADDVMLVGYSQGGLVASSLLADEDFRSKAPVSTMFTVGAPISDFPPPEGVDVLSIEHEQDLIPDVDGNRNADSAEHTTLTVDLDKQAQRDVLARKGMSTEELDEMFSEPLVAHDGHLYTQTIGGLEEDANPEVTQWHERNSHFFEGDVGETHDFVGTRR